MLISVKDTGIGIPAEKLEIVFQEFTQVDTTTTRKAGGTGLGLPISRHLIEMHGGRLWAESTGMNGEGSTFYVELPIEAQITERGEIGKVRWPSQNSCNAPSAATSSLTNPLFRPFAKNAIRNGWRQVMIIEVLQARDPARLPGPPDQHVALSGYPAADESLRS